MAAVNRVILLGNLGADPETRYMPSGDPICTIRLATTERFKDKAGERQERTEWHRVVFFGRLAEIVAQYLTKGRAVYVEGTLRTRKWQAQDGSDRYSTEVVASEMQMLGDGKNEHHDAQRATERSGYTPPPSSAGSAPMGDDIPF